MRLSCLLDLIYVVFEFFAVNQLCVLYDYSELRGSRLAEIAALSRVKAWLTN